MRAHATSMRSGLIEEIYCTGHALSEKSASISGTNTIM
jgi:hypothetical protein